MPEPGANNSNESRHNFSDDAKQMCISLMEGRGGASMSPAQLAKYEGFPAERTLRLWKHEFENPIPLIEEPSNLGRPPLLTDDELDVVGGFILFCAQAHQCCSVLEIENFIDIAFNRKVDESYISKHVHKLGFSSHRPASLKYTYGGVDTAKAAVDFLRDYQSILANVENRSRVVAVDQISFWDCGIVTSTYSLIGG